MKEETFNYSKVPHNFGLCATDTCPYTDTCLRRIAYTYAPSNNIFLYVLNPKAIESTAGKCKYYCSNKKVRYAKGFIQLIAPFAPHLAEELWQTVAETGESISYVAWPTWDESKLVEDEIEIVVQIKGKVRAKLMVAKDLSREELQEVALANEKVKAEIDGKEIVKVIAVPNKLVNIVVK